MPAATEGMADPAVELPRVAYIFTRFPHLTETFLQREVEGLVQLGLRPDLYSFHGGGGEFCGISVRRVSKWILLRLFWVIPRELWRRPVFFAAMARRLFTGWPRDWMNHWENLYGAGIAVVLAASFRRERYDHIHGVWGSFPAMAAWMLGVLTDTPFSFGAHAYDLFEYGGDWLLREKAAAARFVHTSTEAGVRRLRRLGVAADRIQLARRGLAGYPAAVERGAVREPIRLVCIARLVPKKGLLRQVAVYKAARQAGIGFAVRIIGDGPLRGRLQAEIRSAGLESIVTLVGALPQEQVWDELAAADVLVHTGEVARSGDRDGLPNVVPEAMASGAIVITTPGEGVCEAIEAGVTGLVCEIADHAGWIRCLRQVRDDTELCARIRMAARAWVEENFDARRNAALLLARFRQSGPGSRQGCPGGEIPSFRDSPDDLL